MVKNMERILRAIKLLRKDMTYGENIIVYLNNDTLKMIAKIEFELGISEYKKALPSGNFDGCCVVENVNNSVALIKNHEIIKEVKLADNLFV